MRIHWFRSVLLIAAAGIAVAAWSPVRAGDLIVDLGKAVDISMVGAVQRWDEEGKPRFPVDPKAKIAERRVNARAVRQGSGKWIFRNLPPAAFECGAIVNPDHLRNQVEGCLIMGLGAALFEAISFENGKILNPRLSRYPVPRFGDIPQIDVVLRDRKELPAAGGGETPIVAVAPAIANAIYSATGKPVAVDAAGAARSGQELIRSFSFAHEGFGLPEAPRSPRREAGRP